MNIVHLNRFVIFTILILLSVQVHSDDLSNQQLQLDLLGKELKSLQETLNNQKGNVSEQRVALKEVETEMGRNQKALSKLTKGLAQLKQQTAALSQEKISLEQRLAKKSGEIEAILRLAYKQNNQPLIKLLLSGQRPEDYSRYLYYFSALTSNQQVQLTSWLEEQEQLSRIMLEHKAQSLLLDNNQKELLGRNQTLVKQKNKRAQVLANIEAEVESTEQIISRKELERTRLTELVAELQARLDNLNLDFPEAEAIAVRKGQLIWPVQGRLQNRYGQSIASSRLNWQGLLIAATSGEPVHAVHGGRVIFADFFKTNGLLVIIDHGNGIWTLYGRNRALLREVGSWVEAGDVIAEVGQSGGYNSTGLYFEIRNNGTPENPTTWLMKR